MLLTEPPLILAWVTNVSANWPRAARIESAPKRINRSLVFMGAFLI